MADLSGLNGTGQFSVVADIYVDGVADVGALGSYSVLVTLSEREEETAVEVTTAAQTSEETEESQEPES